MVWYPTTSIFPISPTFWRSVESTRCLWIPWKKGVQNVGFKSLRGTSLDHTSVTRFSVVVVVFLGGFREGMTYRGPPKRTLLHEKINPKDWQVLSLGDAAFLQFFRVVSSDYGKPRILPWDWNNIIVYRFFFWDEILHPVKWGIMNS